MNINYQPYEGCPYTYIYKNALALNDVDRVNQKVLNVSDSEVKWLSQWRMWLVEAVIRFLLYSIHNFSDIFRISYMHGSSRVIRTPPGFYESP